MMAAFVLQDELLKILNDKQLTPHFQPIVSLRHKKIIGYEALIRGPSDSPLHSPGVLFNAAERFNLSTKLEFICRELTIKRYAELNISEKLFININPAVLLQPDFKNGETLKLLDQHQVDPASVVIELTEHYPADDYELMHEAMLHYREMGFQIAIDDLGCGYSGLRLWAELLPDYVKIDKHFIGGLDKDTVKHNFVRSIQAIASSLNCTMIAEGVETEAEFKAIAKLGITHAQGYYFARPTATPLVKVDQNLFVSERSDGPQLSYFNVKTAADIAKFVPPVASATKVSEVMRLFQRVPELSILPLVDKNKATGIVFREQFLSKLFASHYGMELFGKKPISKFIDKPPLMITYNATIQSVSQQLTSMIENDQAFIVTRNDVYVGVATVLDLLAEITRQQIQYAKYANPLTLLPGSVPINDYVNQLLAKGKSFTVGYFDLDNFKPFNDVYGYSAGDDIIKAIADILIKQVSQECGMVGHIGGDDFIVVFTNRDWLVCCQNILEAFGLCVPEYYNAKDREAGGICSDSRSGERCFFPLISLSVGLVDPTLTSQCQSHVEIADLAAEAKKQAKKITGNSFFINRRKRGSCC